MLVFQRGRVSTETLEAMGLDREPSHFQLIWMLEHYGELLTDSERAEIIEHLGPKFMGQWRSASVQWILDQMDEFNNYDSPIDEPESIVVEEYAQAFERELEEHLRKHQGRDYRTNATYCMAFIRAVAAGASPRQASDIAWRAYRQETAFRPQSITRSGLKCEDGRLLRWSYLPRAYKQGRVEASRERLQKALEITKAQGWRWAVRALESVL